ncbi:MAG: hypothetical protein HYV09_40295 [Deltaproteobacteria bacterium]|nr:hypothetical protein [Deltaproteobacteria bacterium]
MIGLLPEPLEPDWANVLAEVAREVRLPGLDDPRLPGHVSKMAAVYNDDRLRGLGGSREQLAARLSFWFPRDVPKMAGAARELIAMGRLRIGQATALRVLDVGAGLGASHRGLARALAAAGGLGTVDVLAVDDDRDALRVAAAIAKKRPREGAVDVRLKTEEASFVELVKRPPRGRFGVILVGQMLSELDLELDEAARVELHAEQLAALAREALEPDGVLLIVEPALRPRSRHLQRLRAALLQRRLRVLAPCLHEGRCPLLGRDTDWCHEDLAVDLPPFLQPVAKKAGLRWEGLTFSYLALSSKPPRLVDSLTAGPDRERAVSALLVSKGKRELVVCGDPLRGDVAGDDPLGPHGARIGRLDRARSEVNAVFDDLGRGDVVSLGPLDEKLRLGPDAPIEHLSARVARVD